MSIKWWRECMFKKLINTKIQFFANINIYRSNKCELFWYKYILDIFPLSIPFLSHISTIFSLALSITVYESLLLKVIPETKRSIISKDLHLLTLLIKLDTRLSVLLDDLSIIYSRSFTPTCNIAPS